MYTEELYLDVGDFDLSSTELHRSSTGTQQARCRRRPGYRVGLKLHCANAWGACVCRQS